MKINTHPLMLDEVLEIINAAEDVSAALKREYINQPYLRYYMDASVNSNWTTIDTHEVTHTKSDYHRSMAGALLLSKQTVNIFESVLLKKEVAKRPKIFQYKALAEMLYVGESVIFDAVLHKDIASIYPNITFAVIVESLE